MTQVPQVSHITNAAERGAMRQASIVERAKSSRKSSCFRRGLNTGPCAYETHALPLSYESGRFIVIEGHFSLYISGSLIPSMSSRTRKHAL